MCRVCTMDIWVVERCVCTHVMCILSAEAGSGLCRHFALSSWWIDLICIYLLDPRLVGSIFVLTSLGLLVVYGHKKTDSTRRCMLECQKHLYHLYWIIQNSRQKRITSLPVIQSSSDNVGMWWKEICSSVPCGIFIVNFLEGFFFVCILVLLYRHG